MSILFSSLIPFTAALISPVEMEWKPAKKLGRKIRKNMAENSKFLDGQLCLMLTGIGGCWAVLRSLTGKQEGGYVRNLVNPQS